MVASLTHPDAPPLRRAVAPIDRAWASIPILVPAIIALASRMGTIDLAYHVRAGDEIRAASALPTTDTWTFTVRGTPWTDQQWGSQVILSFAHTLTGWASVMLLWAVLCSLVTWLIYRACRARGIDVRSAALLSVAAYVVAQPALSLRPQLLALPGFAVALWAVWTRGVHPRRLWILPVAAAVTANLHGSFVMFPLLAVLALIEDRRDARKRRLDVGVLVVCLVATLVNPYGIDAWTYAYRLSTNPLIRNMITEWQPITITSLAGYLVFGSALGVGAFLARRRDAVSWTDLLWLGVFLLLALTAQRAILWWALVFPVVVAGLIKPRSRGEDLRAPALPAHSVIAVLVLAVVALLPWWRGADGSDLLKDAPPGLTAAVDGLPPGTHLLVHQPWGSWFQFAVRDVPVFVDSRIELFPEHVWEAYRQVGFSGALWRDTLKEHDVGAIVAHIEDWDLIPILRTDPGWRVSYEDDDGVLFVRS